MKKNLIRMALAGALAFGVASVSKAADEAAAPVFSVVAQELATQSFGTLSKTSTTNNATSGDQLGLSLQHVILGTSYNIDALDTLTVSADVNAAGNVAGNNNLYLLNAYDTHSLADLNAGLAVKAGQLRIAFGADAYSSPDQLIRTGYSSIDGLINGGKVADGGANYDLGVELAQTYSDLTIQVAAVQNPSAFSTSNTTNTGSGTQFDYVGRAQWKGSNVSLGLSDYYQAVATGATPNNTNNLNTLGANASVNVDVFTLDLEAIFGRSNTNGYTATLSAKPVAGFQAAAWYEFTADNFTPAVNTNGVLSNDLGLGVNFWLGAKTRLAINEDFTGYNGSTVAADLLALNSTTVQLQEVF